MKKIALGTFAASLFMTAGFNFAVGTTSYVYIPVDVTDSTGVNTLNLISANVTNLPLSVLPCTISKAASLPSVVGIATSSGGGVYVSDATGNVYALAGGPAPAIRGKLSLSSDPLTLAVQGATLYAADSAQNALYVIELDIPGQPLSLKLKLTGFNAPAGVAVNPQKPELYVVNSQGPGPGTLSVLNISNPQQPPANIGVGVGPTGVAVSSDGTTAYVTNQQSASVSVIDLTSRSVVQTIPLNTSDYPVGVAALPGGNIIVANRGRGHALGSVYIISNINNPQSPPTVTPLVNSTNPWKHPFGVTVSADGRYVFVNDIGAKNFQEIDLSNPAQPLFPQSPPFSTVFSGQQAQEGAELGDFAN